MRRSDHQHSMAVASDSLPFPEVATSSFSLPTSLSCSCRVCLHAGWACWSSAWSTFFKYVFSIRSKNVTSDSQIFYKLLTLFLTRWLISDIGEAFNASCNGLVCSVYN